MYVLLCKVVRYFFLNNSELIFQQDVMEGIQSPYVYVGSPLTAFAFHLEDGNLNSINYLHRGKPKVW